MPQQLFHLEGPDLKDLKAQAAARYGPRALIVSAELVTVGGINGMFGRKHYEIVVEVPERDDGAVDPGATAGAAGAAAPAGAATAAGSRPHGRRRAATAAGAIDVLLEQAELDEVRFASGTEVPSGPRESADEPASLVSTDSNLFAALMDNLTFATDGATAVPAGAEPAESGTPVLVPSAVLPAAAGAEAQPAGTTDHLGEESADPAALPRLAGPVVRVPAAGPPVPTALRAAGDLVVVIGSPAVSWDVVHSMAMVLGGGHPAALAVSGPPGRFPRDVRAIADRLDANAARAAGVDGGHAVFVALTSSDVVADGRFLLALRPDQVWLAVDAGRKEADTAAWVGAQARSMERAGLRPAGLAVVGSKETSTPETVLTLGLPVGWLDGRPAGAASDATSMMGAGAPSMADPARRPLGSGRRRAEPAGIE
ncbi:hypothetical protein E8P82_12935 [Arthrobacter echini]|uniref:Uncharacterized protein n=1 Tax=Arthrobacter echini TaxID=1529066 RepID=A0A4S5E180_9MICC|nr:hypothetical protein [Arthrobacter echini]THJ65032.1 hypothetical protein E8P82_12935 [Arthrobacter echini]